MKIRIKFKDQVLEELNIKGRIGGSQLFTYAKGSPTVKKALNGQVIDVCTCSDLDKDGNMDYVITGVGPTNVAPVAPATQPESTKPTPAQVQAPNPATPKSANS